MKNVQVYFLPEYEVWPEIMPLADDPAARLVQARQLSEHCQKIA